MLENHKKLLNKEKQNDMHDHLNELSMKRSRMKILLESRVPEVGIFWVLDKNEILQHSVPWTEVSSYPEGYLVGDWANFGDHMAFWRAHHKALGLSDDYTDYPRGRVVFNVLTKKAKIIIGKKEAKNKRLLYKIEDSFSLHKPTVDKDDHYGTVIPDIGTGELDIDIL